MRSNKLDHVIAFARKELENEKSGHDFKHVQRVANYAKMIVEGDQLSVDSFVVQASAYLHDVIDDKVVEDVASKVKEVEALLSSLEVSEAQMKDILHSIQNMSYSKGLTDDVEPLSLAGQIVQDADRLEAVGAMGILRTAYYGGGHGHPIYDEEIKPKTFTSKAEYRQGTTVVNHFYEKLFLLPDKMNTTYARNLAFERKLFMEQFLDQFYAEWHV